METNTTPVAPPFVLALNNFLIELEGLSASLPMFMKSVKAKYDHMTEEMVDFLHKKGEKVELDLVTSHNGKQPREIFKLGLDDSLELDKQRRNAKNYLAAMAIVPRSFVVAMISQYDAFLGQLIRAMYLETPEMLNASGKQITFAELLKFDSLEVAREYILEKEIESILRESHADHFALLEKRLGIPLTKDLDIWPNFIELTERRNLFVHTGGVVSSQYISICQKYNFPLDPNVSVGTNLSVDGDYLKNAYNLLYELATKLTIVIWRKTKSSEIEEIDTYLNAICYDLLKREDYKLAEKLLSFALSFSRHSSTRTKLMFMVNLAIAYKWGNQPQKAQKMILETDWSACSADFQLVSHVLLDKFDKAEEIMRRIGRDDSVHQIAYKDWPAFKDFRQSAEFKRAYQEVFGKFFDTVEISEEMNKQGLPETAVNILEEELPPSKLA